MMTGDDDRAHFCIGVVDGVNRMRFATGSRAA
jgi:hypothetical protein